MISILKSGIYKLIETRRHIKILHLDGSTYAWIEPKNIGEILVTTHLPHKTDCVLAVGRYVLYRVRDVPKLADTTHLELEIGRHQWQGYLLLTGLPDDHKKRSRIIPTHEVITGNRHFAARKPLHGNLVRTS